MAFFLDTFIPENKPIFLALSEFYGIGIKTTKLICKNHGINYNIKFNKVPNSYVLTLIRYISKNYIINEELKKNRIEQQNTLLKINHYRGHRRKNKLPTRGQRTRTNAQTIKKL